MRAPSEPEVGQLADPLIGQQIGEFRVERMIASGGMGAVYLMRHVLLPNTRKVLKVILPHMVGMPHVRARFLAEADALSQLGSHPSIVGIDSHTTLPGGQLAIIMPFVEGLPLEEYVAGHGGKLPPHRAFFVACHIARGLHHAHMLGIVHRDLKPANVIVEPDDNDWAKCKLLDFGVARRLNPNPSMPTQTYSGPCGTPDFMPPEQQDRAAEATSAADVYAFAVMLWWMVTGSYPWGRQHDPAILYLKKLTTPPDPAPGDTLPVEWERWLRAALNPDPSARPSLRQIMQGLAQALPSVGRLVPSGPEILQRIARVLAEDNDPDDPTLRNPSSRTLQPPWPQLDPRRPSTGSNPHAHVAAPEPAQASQPATVNAHKSSGASAPVASAPVVNPRDGASAPSHHAIAARELDAPAGAGAPISARPAPVAIPTHAMVQTPTTIGASSGAILSLPTRAPSRLKLAMFASIAIVVAGGGTFAIATLGSTTEPGAAARRPSTDPPVVSPAMTAPAVGRSGAVAPTAATPARPAPAVVPPEPTAPQQIGSAAAPSAPTTKLPLGPAATGLSAEKPTAAPKTASAPTLTKRPSSAPATPSSSAAVKSKAATPTSDPAHNKPSGDHRNRKFNPNAAVSIETEED